MFGKKGNIIGLLLSAVCMFMVFRKVDWTALLASLASLNYAYVVLAIAVFLTTFTVRTLRWQALLRPTKEIGFKRLFSVIFIGYMSNNVLPARLGEVVRAYVLSRKEGVRKSTTLATIFIERIFDGLSLLFILGLFMVLYATNVIPLHEAFPAWINKAGLLACVGFVGAFGFVVALEHSPATGEAMKTAIRRFAPENAQARALSVLEAFQRGVSCLRSMKVLLFVFGASLVVWLIEGSTYYLLGQAFGLNVAFHAFLVTMVVVNLGTIIPSAPGFVGTFQLFCVVALGLFGVKHEAALSYGLVLNMAEYLPVTFLGIGFLAAEGLGFGTVLHPDDGVADLPNGTDPAPAALPLS